MGLVRSFFSFACATSAAAGRQLRQRSIGQGGTLRIALAMRIGRLVKYVRTLFGARSISGMRMGD